MIGTDRLAKMTEGERKEAMALLQEIQRRRKSRKFFAMYPDEGPYRRELYPRHMRFLEATRDYNEAAFRAGNRVGKSEMGAFMVTAWATGKYPPWWTGRRFSERVDIWAAGDTSKTVRDIIQEKLLGPPGAIGTGMIPAEMIAKTTAKAGVPDAIDTIWVKHYDKFGYEDGRSVIALKTYEQGRESFQGTAQHVIWLDEECSMEIYMECLMRTMTTEGVVILTYTPLKGVSDVVLMFEGAEY